MRAIIELHCQRIPAKPFEVGKPSEPSTGYNGRLVMRSEPGSIPQNHLEFPFQSRELGEIAVWMHYLVRLLSETRTEFCIRMFQKGPNTTRPPVAMDLDAAQVNKIYESPESASIFFAPRERTIKRKTDAVEEG